MRSLKLVELPGLPAKGDVTAWLARGGSKDELVRIVKFGSASQKKQPSSTRPSASTATRIKKMPRSPGSGSPGETAKQYQAFAMYRDLPAENRSVGWGSAQSRYDSVLARPIWQNLVAGNLNRAG